MLGKVVFGCVLISIVVKNTEADRKQDVLFAEYGSLGTKADFYSEEYLNGQSTTIETNGPCKNLPKSWRGRPLSVDTKGTCGKVCDEVDCRGTCKYIHPNKGEQKLSEIGFERKVHSIQGCFQDRNKN